MDLLKKVFSKINRKKESSLFFNYRLNKYSMFKKSDFEDPYERRDVDETPMQETEDTIPQPTVSPILQEKEDVGAHFDKVVNFVANNINIINNRNFSIFANNFINREGVEEYPDEDVYERDFIKSTFEMFRNFQFDNFVFMYISGFNDVELYSLAENVSVKLNMDMSDEIYFLFECLKRKDIYNTIIDDSVQEEEAEEDEEEVQNIYDLYDIDRNIPHPGIVFVNKMEELLRRDAKYPKGSRIGEAVEWYRRNNRHFNDATGNVFYGVRKGRGPYEIFNFFLEYPKYFQDILNSDLDFKENFKQFISSGSSKKDKCGYIAMEKGNELLQRLNTLIMDENTDVFKWVLNEAGALGKGEEYRKEEGFGEGDEGEILYPTDVKDRSSQRKDEKEIEKEKEKAYNIATNASYGFLKNNIEGTKKVKNDVFEGMIENIASNIDTVTDKKNIIDKYTSYEIMNLHLSKTIEQFNSFLYDKNRGDVETKFNLEGSGDQKIIKGVLLKNQYGKIYIDIKSIFEMLMMIKKDENIIRKYPEIQHYDLNHLDEKMFENIFEIYENEYKEGHEVFNKSWSNVMTNIAVAENNAILNMVKKAIIDNKKFVMENINSPHIVNNFLEFSPYDGFRDDLFYVSGVDQNDTTNDIQNKIFNFIKMTVYQDEYGALKDLELYEDIYNLSKRNNILKEQLVPERNEEKKGRIKEEILENQKIINKMGHDKRSRLIEHFRKGSNNVLYNLFNAKQSKDIDDSVMRSIVDSFYPPTSKNEYRTFLGGEGMKGRTVKDSRGEEKFLTNSEMYFYIRGEEIPEDIKYFIEIHKKGLDRYGKITPYKSEAALHGIRKKNPYNNFFFYVNKVFDMNKKKEKLHEENQILEEDIQKRIQTLNRLLDLFISNLETLSSIEDEKRIKKILKQRMSNNYVNYLLHMYGNFTKLNPSLRDDIKNKIEADDFDFSDDRYVDEVGKNAIYNIFPRTKDIKMIDKMKNDINENNQKISDIEKYKEYYRQEAKKEIPFIQEDIPDLDLSKLKLAYLRYRNMMKKIALLRDMSKFKFASYYNTEEQVQKMYNDFDIFFKKLFK